MSVSLANLTHDIEDTQVRDKAIDAALASMFPVELYSAEERAEIRTGLEKDWEVRHLQCA